MNPVKSTLQTAMQNHLYQLNTRRHSSALSRTREILKDTIEVSPLLMNRISSYEQAEQGLLEAKRQAGSMKRADAAERISSIKERLKLLKLFSQLGDKKIAREAARLAGEINKTLRLYRSALQEAEAEETAAAQDTDSSSEDTSDTGQATDTGQTSESSQESNTDQAQNADSSAKGTPYDNAASDAGQAVNAAQTSKTERAKEEASILKEAEEALKIAREIIEEYIRMHPQDRDNKALRRQIEDAAQTIAMMKLDVITTTVSSLVAVA